MSPLKGYPGATFVTTSGELAELLKTFTVSPVTESYDTVHEYFFLDENLSKYRDVFKFYGGIPLVNIYKDKVVLITGHTGLKAVGFQFGSKAWVQKLLVWLMEYRPAQVIWSNFFRHLDRRLSDRYPRWQFSFFIDK